MNNVERFHAIVELVRKSTTVVINITDCDMPNGFADLLSGIVILELPNDEVDYDYISCLLIHEYGHVLCFKSMRWAHHPPSNSAMEYREELRAWTTGSDWASKHDLLPSNFTEVMDSCLSTYTIHYAAIA